MVNKTDAYRRFIFLEIVKSSNCWSIHKTLERKAKSEKRQTVPHAHTQPRAQQCFTSHKKNKIIIIIINISIIIKKKQLRLSTPRAHFPIVTYKDDFRTSFNRDPVFADNFNHLT